MLSERIRNDRRHNGCVCEVTLVPSIIEYVVQFGWETFSERSSTSMTASQSYR